MGKHSKRNEKSGSYNPDGTPISIGQQIEEDEATKKGKSFDELWEASKNAAERKRGWFR